MHVPSLAPQPLPIPVPPGETSSEPRSLMEKQASSCSLKGGSPGSLTPRRCSVRDVHGRHYGELLAPRGWGQGCGLASPSEERPLSGRQPRTRCLLLSGPWWQHPQLTHAACPFPAGTPVNRIPIMAKQVLDLFMLYVLVTEKGGLVEVINKKLWREITKGLNLPTSITSAAFTLRTQ